jgi:hypothetical protein
MTCVMFYSLLAGVLSMCMWVKERLLGNCSIRSFYLENKLKGLYITANYALKSLWKLSVAWKQNINYGVLVAGFAFDLVFPSTRRQSQTLKRRIYFWSTHLTIPKDNPSIFILHHCYRHLRTTKNIFLKEMVKLLYIRFLKFVLYFVKHRLYKI